LTAAYLENRQNPAWYSQPNTFGLFCMNDGVREWTENPPWHYPSGGTRIDQRGGPLDKLKSQYVVRGGSYKGHFEDDGRYFSSYFRQQVGIEQGRGKNMWVSDIGFRVARVASPLPSDE
jgi:formylglycine-generating enzyme required for sulfatase activity